MSASEFLNRRLAGSISLVAVASLLAPPLFSFILDTSQHRFDPAQFNLPSSAKEVVSKRTDSTATFEIERGKYAQVSGIDPQSHSTCSLWLCSIMNPIRNLLPDAFALSAGPNSPGTVTTSNASGGTADWIDPNNAKIEDGLITLASLGSSGGQCLSEETYILTEFGSIMVKNLQEGDRVYSYNFLTNEIELKSVGSIIKNSISVAYNQYYHIEFAGGDIRVTSDHLFYTKGDYVPAMNLEVGDALMHADGAERIVKKITIESNSTDEIYEVAVNDNHNYFANGVLVHNAGVYDHRVRILKGGIVGSTDKADATAWPTSLAYQPVTGYGSPSDKWGETWEVSDINASTFGVVISAIATGYEVNHASYYLHATDFGFDIAGTIDGIVVDVKKQNNFAMTSIRSAIDHIRITVYYAEAAAVPVPFFSWWSVPLLLLGIGWFLRRERMLSSQTS